MAEHSNPSERIRQILGGIEKLPMLPAVAVRLLEVTEDEKSSAIDLARLIETDQALAAKTMRMANSAYYGRSGKISTLRDAVALVGFGALRSTILTVFFMDVFKKTSNDTGFDTEAFWLHSLACAICAREIGKKTQGPASFAEEAFVCGMLHDAGKILLNNYLPGDYGKVVDAVEKLSRASHVQPVFILDIARWWNNERRGQIIRHPRPDRARTRSCLGPNRQGRHPACQPGTGP